MSPLDLLSIGRVSVDLYAEQPGVTMSDVTTFRSPSAERPRTSPSPPPVTATRRCDTRGDDQFGRYVADALRNTFNVDRASSPPIRH